VMAAASRADRQDLGEYYRLLQQAGTDSELWDDLIGTITVGETYFFRDQAQFDVLRQHILPALIARHQDDRRLRIWSAGCATGEEPYSVAILLRQFLPDIANWSISSWPRTLTSESCNRPVKAATGSGPSARPIRPSARATSASGTVPPAGLRTGSSNSGPRCGRWSPLPT